MKRFAAGLVFGALLFLLNACASHDADTTATTSDAAVPGEKVSGDALSAGAGPGTANASLKW